MTSAVQNDLHGTSGEWPGRQPMILVEWETSQAQLDRDRQL